MKQEQIEKILEEHKAWLNRTGGAKADLHGADLRGADLCGANLCLSLIHIYSFHFPCGIGAKRPGSTDCKAVGIRTWRTLDEVL